MNILDKMLEEWEAQKGPYGDITDYGKVLRALKLAVFALSQEKIQHEWLRGILYDIEEILEDGGNAI